MNSSEASPPMLPSQTAQLHPASRSIPLGENPEEREPIIGLVAAVEAILRQPRRVLFQLRQKNNGFLILALAWIALLCSITYGLVVGTFAGGTQLWAAPLKISAGLLISTVICLPSLYIFSCLSGSQARLVEVIGLVAGLAALATLLLIGLAPVAWIFSQSTDVVAVIGSLHLTFWIIASYFGLRFLHQGFRHLNTTMDGNLRIWMAIFLLVTFQMTTTLRPIVGSAPRPLQTEKKFFLGHWFETLNK